MEYKLKKFFRRDQLSLDPWRDWRRLLWVFGFLLLVSLIVAYFGLDYFNNLAAEEAGPARETAFSEADRELIEATARAAAEREEIFRRWRAAPPAVIDPAS